MATINGTFNSLIAGTLSGTIGTPGPTGATGATGATGPGVAAGGTAGQFLTKTTTGVDYATNWTTVNLSAYLTKAGNLAGLTSLSTARDNLNLGTANTPVFNGLTAQGSGSNAAQLSPTSLTLTQTGSGIFTIQPSQGIVFPDSTVQTTAYPGPVGATQWGSIGGSLINQTDLYDVLAAKLDTSTAASTYYLQTNPDGFLTDAPSDGSQYARQDGAWSVVTGGGGGSYLPLAGGTMTGAIVFDGTSGQYISKGNFDTSRGGNYGISLVCSIGYEFNWQAGWLTTTNQGTTTPRPLYLDSLAGTTLRAWNSAADNGVEVSHTGINVANATPYYVNVAPDLVNVFEATNELGVSIAHDSIAIQHIDTPDRTSYFTNEYIGFEDMSGTPHSAWIEHDVITVQDETYTTQMRSDGISLSAAGSITFGDSTVQTTAYTGGGGLITSVTAPLAVTSGDLSVDLSSYLLSSTATSTYAPIDAPTFTGYVSIPSYASIGTGATIGATAIIDTGATITSPTLSGVPITPTAATSDNSFQVASTAFVKNQAYITASALTPYAPIASPGFTGSPSMPTGTIGVTQTAGNSTTALATTAFVTTAVPAIATFAESQQLTSTTKVMSPFDVGVAMMTEGYRPAMIFGSATSGTGASVGLTTNAHAQITGPNVLTAGYAYVISSTANGFSTASAASQTVVFNRSIWITGTYDAFSATYQGDANTETKVYLGTNMGNGNDPTAACIGWWKLGGASSPFNLMVHDGTTLTKVASGTSTVNSATPFRWMVYSDGSGNVTLYINGTSVATTALGPKGSTQSNVCSLTAAVKASVTATTRMVNDFTYPKLFIAPQ